MSDRDLIGGKLRLVDEGRLRERLFHIASDPLPFRKASYTVPGHAKSTLDEMDDFVAERLAGWGWAVERTPYQCQAFARNYEKPVHHQYDAPREGDPFYTLYNIHGRKRGRELPEETIVLVAHKDSMSWIDSPGAYDNGSGTVTNLEIARALADYEPRRNLWLLFCNEEHTPWTSFFAAQEALAAGVNCIGIFNNDSLGGKGVADLYYGRHTNVTLYSEPEARPLALLMNEVVERFSIGLEQRVAQREFPNDDDGMFVKAGYPLAIANLGSFPYLDPCYHMECDRPERVDYPNLVKSTQAVLAAVLTLDLA